MGAIVGIFIVILGIASILHYFINTNNINGNYLLAGIGCIFVGSMFLWKSVPAFIPIKQQTPVAESSCPYCGALVKKDVSFCEKCKQKLD